MIVPNESRIGTRTKFVIFGKSFDTLAEAEKHRDSTIERREAIAGRRLSETELMRGIRDGRQPGWDTPGEKIAAEKWQPIRPPIEPKPVSFEPVGKVNDYGTAMHPNKRAAIAEQQYLERKSREAGLAVPADPTRTAAKEYALSVWEKTAFNPHATESQLAKAEQLLQQCEHCLETFADMADTFATQTAIQHAERAIALNNQIAATSQQLNALEPLPAFAAPTESNTNESV